MRYEKNRQSVVYMITKWLITRNRTSNVLPIQLKVGHLKRPVSNQGLACLWGALTSPKQMV